MTVKRIKKIRIGSTNFNVTWDKSKYGASFSYNQKSIVIGTNDLDDLQIFGNICHEIFEIVSEEMYVRHGRRDCTSDYIFAYDHRQFSTMMDMFSGLIAQFLK